MGEKIYEYVLDMRESVEYGAPGRRNEPCR